MTLGGLLKHMALVEEQYTIHFDGEARPESRLYMPYCSGGSGRHRAHINQLWVSRCDWLAPFGRCLAGRLVGPGVAVAGLPGGCRTAVSAVTRCIARQDLCALGEVLVVSLTGCQPRARAPDVSAMKSTCRAHPPAGSARRGIRARGLTECLREGTALDHDPDLSICGRLIPASCASLPPRSRERTGEPLSACPSLPKQPFNRCRPRALRLGGASHRCAHGSVAATFAA
jgi:hypothetical protein